MARTPVMIVGPASAATVASIASAGDAHELGRIQGLMNVNVDHVVPPHAVVLDFKFCENCGRPFTRARGKSIRYCGRCVSRSLMPPDQQERDDYRDQLPNENIAHLSYHLPRYDNSLTGTGGPSNSARSHGHKLAQLSQRTRRRTRSILGDWMVRLLEAFALGPLTSQQIAAIIGGKYGATSEAVSQARLHGIHLEIVGCIYPRPSCMGTVPKLYAVVPDEYQDGGGEVDIYHRHLSQGQSRHNGHGASDHA